MISSKSRPPQRGFFVPALVAVLLVIIFIILLFGVRLLEKKVPVGVKYSERYHELAGKAELSEIEAAELELETCRFKRDLLTWLEQNRKSDHVAALEKYRESCAGVLPL